MRFGVILIHMGIYLIYISTKLIRTDQKKDLKEKESYNKNVWHTNIWERFNFLWIWVLFLMFELY